jgi:hypothetical protein
MAELTRQKKITFAEMRASGVRGLLIYCSDYRCSHGPRSAATGGPTVCCCRTLSTGSFAAPALTLV